MLTSIPAKLCIVSVIVIISKPDVCLELLLQSEGDFLCIVIFVVIWHREHQVAIAEIVTDKDVCFGLAVQVLKGVVMQAVPSSSGTVTTMKAGVYFNTRDLRLSDKEDLNLLFFHRTVGILAQSRWIKRIAENNFVGNGREKIELMHQERN